MSRSLKANSIFRIDDPHPYIHNGLKWDASGFKLSHELRGSVDLFPHLTQCVWPCNFGLTMQTDLSRA